jgi:hypothetical protein
METLPAAAAARVNRVQFVADQRDGTAGVQAESPCPRRRLNVPTRCQHVQHPVEWLAQFSGYDAWSNQFGGHACVLFK